MKFEANIPSYLRTGEGVFPVKKRAISKPESLPDNFYEQARKGFHAPTTNESRDITFAPMDEPVQVQDNFLEKMQRTMEGELEARGPVKPIPGQLPLPFDTPSDAEIELDDELPKSDIFIG